MITPVLEYAKSSDQLIIFTDGGLVTFDMELTKFNKKPIWVLTEGYYNDKLSNFGQVITTYKREQVYN